MTFRRGFDVKALPAAAGLNPRTGQLGLDDLGIVQYEPIAHLQYVRQVADMVVLDRLALAIDNHEPGVGPMAERFLRHELAGNLVIQGIIGVLHR